MFAASIYMKFGENLSTEAVVRNHAFNSELYHSYRVIFQHIASFYIAVAAEVTGMTEIDFLSQFFAGQNNLICIDNDYVITGVHMRGKGRFVFTAQDFCNLCSQAAQSLISCVNNEPFAFDVRRISHKRFHRLCPS